MKRFEYAIARKPGDVWIVVWCDNGKRIAPFHCINSLEMLREMGFDGWSLACVEYIPGDPGTEFFYFQREL